MTRLKNGWTKLLGTLAVVAVLGFGATAAASHRAPALQQCTTYSSQEECRDCSIREGFDGGICSPGGACFCT